MSNRAKWAHWNKRKPAKEGPLQRPLAAFILVAIGSLIALVAVEGIRDHALWTMQFSPRFGTFIVAPTSDLFLLSGFFILLGIFAWYGRL